MLENEKRIVLHIGLHKTGTTFLQKKIFPNLSGWVLLTRPYTQQNKAFNCLQFADDTLYDPEAILAEIDRIPGSQIIISDESLSGKPSNFHYINRSMIYRRFAEAFPEAKVILVIRGQRDMLVSSYRNHIQTFPKTYLRAKDLIWQCKRNYTFAEYQGNPLAPTLEETLYYNNNYDNFHLDGYHYYQQVKYLKSLFPDCHVLLYEDLQADPEAYINRLESIIGGRVEGVSQINLRQRVRKGSSDKKLAAFRIRNWVLKKTGNATIAGISRTLAEPFLTAKKIKEDIAYIESLVDGYYDHSNALLHQHFPEIGIDRYPDSYKMGKHKPDEASPKVRNYRSL
jgi:hypothetical protein